MSSDIQPYILDELDAVIDQIVANIGLYTQATSFRELKYALGGINFHSKKDDFIKMKLFAHFIMFNAVSRSIACVSVPQTNHKYPYAIDFKMACLIVRYTMRDHQM